MTLRHPHVIRILAWLLGSVVVLLIGAIGVGAATYERAYADRIFPGVMIGSIDVGGQTKTEATEKVQRTIDSFLSSGIRFELGNRLVTVNPIVIAPRDPDLHYELVAVDIPGLVADAYAMGRDDSIVSQWSERIRGAAGDSVTISLRATIDVERLATALRENFRDVIVPMTRPQIIRVRDGTDAQWIVSDGRSGVDVDVTTAAAMTILRIAALDPAPVSLATVSVPSPYARTDVEKVLPAIDAALTRTPITITHDEQRWTFDRETIATWLAVDANGVPTVNTAAITEAIAPMAESIERQPADAKFVFDPATKRVHEFRFARNGIRIDRDVLVAAVHDALFGTAVPLVTLPVITTPPTITLEGTNDLGIRELLGTGQSNFVGSPTNRRHNIGIGTKLLNGLLIAPGETFSLVSAISPFSAAGGYREELVIKGSRTIPEFGGGLCQVATTLFRAALAAGLPIIERTNHAYRVSYYEPPIGMDATVYGPKPDLVFRNDTSRHLLLATRVAGNELIYEIWGTPDGRVAKTTEPEMFNVVGSPPMKTVETEDLKPGEKKCTERAHSGADAKFTYTVIYADGRQEERVFVSHYRPWQAVCLVGRAPEATPALGADGTVPSSADTATPPAAIPEGNAATPPLAPTTNTSPPIN
ncbi:MAG: VanW family protein [Candidatus Uhrbacteria bacterium]